MSVILFTHAGPGTLTPCCSSDRWLRTQAVPSPWACCPHSLPPRYMQGWHPPLHLLKKCYLPYCALFKDATHLPSAFPIALTLLWLSLFFCRFYQFHTFHKNDLLIFCGHCLTPHYPPPVEFKLLRTIIFLLSTNISPTLRKVLRVEYVFNKYRLNEWADTKGAYYMWGDALAPTVDYKCKMTLTLVLKNGSGCILPT